MHAYRKPEIRRASSGAELEAALAVRVAVFVDEQGGPASDEPDEWDAEARHYLVVSDGGVVGTARLYSPEPGVAKIGRVALLPEWRGRGWGALLLEHLLGEARSGAFGAFREVVLHAQTSACPFYERFGFRPEGDEFIEGGIAHVRMRLRLR